MARDREEVSRRETAEIAELEVHVRLVIVAGNESDFTQRASAFVEQRKRATKADDSRIVLGGETYLFAKSFNETFLRESRLVLEPPDGDQPMAGFDPSGHPRHSRITRARAADALGNPVLDTPKPDLSAARVMTALG
jgi:hypothetical protein